MSPGRNVAIEDAVRIITGVEHQRWAATVTMIVPMGFDAEPRVLREFASTSVVTSLRRFVTLGRDLVLQMTTVGKLKYASKSAETRRTSTSQTVLTTMTPCIAAPENATVGTTSVDIWRWAV